MTQLRRFSANTGFLYPGLDFLERIRAAARDGFDAVEFHDEGQRTERAALLEALAGTGLPVVGLNVSMGPTSGCAAIPGERDRARREIEEAAELAEAVDAGAIHVLAGKTDAPGARDAFLESLGFALGATTRTILIEPLCTAKMPDYFLNSLDEAAAIVDELNDPRARILFDCFHVETEHGDALARFREHAHRIGHVQIASVPGRTEPRAGSEAGALDYAALLPAFEAEGFAGPFGCEYVPAASGPDAFAWRDRLGGAGSLSRGSRSSPPSACSASDPPPGSTR